MIVTKFSIPKHVNDLRALIIENSINLKRPFLDMITHITMVDSDIDERVTDISFLSEFDIIFLCDDIYDKMDLWAADDTVSAAQKTPTEILIISPESFQRYNRSRYNVMNTDVLSTNYGKVSNEYLVYLFKEFILTEPQALQQMLVFGQGFIQLLDSLQAKKDLPMNQDFEKMLSALIGGINLSQLIPEKLETFSKSWQQYEKDALWFNIFRATNIIF